MIRKNTFKITQILSSQITLIRKLMLDYDIRIDLCIQSNINFDMQSREDIPYTLCVTQNCFYMQCLTTNRHFSTILSGVTKQQISNSSNNYLKINRRTNKIDEITKQQYQNQVEEVSFTHILKFYNLIGTIIVNQEPYLIVGTNVSQVAKYIEYPIYLINDVQFIPYRSKLFQKSDEIEQESKIIEQLKRNHISKHFYYSYKENITSSLLEQDVNKDKCDVFNEFSWNTKMMEDFRKSKIHQCWTIPIIQGFVAEIISQNKYFTFEYLSISRRSVHMSGTRFNSRGLDEDAHSSNFVETQQIVKCHNNLYVHLSVRGSVPLFWKQIRVRSDIHYMKDKDIDQESIIKQHYDQLQQKYRASITTISLLSKEKSPQKQLKYRFQALFNRNIKNPYLFFDLNEEIKDKAIGQINVTNFVQRNLKVIFGQNPFLLMQNITKQVKYHQTNIPRINCLDCLDRTNVLMARISQFFLRQDSEVNLQEKKIRLTEPFMKQLINIWTTLGNRISEIYCGTASVASHMTKKESNSIKTFLGGAIISLNRYINATTTDVFKQQCIDCLLGRRGILSKTDYFNTNISLQCIKSQEYCKFNTVQTIIITFNSNSISLMQQGQQSIFHFLRFLNDRKCDVLVFHLQEVAQSQKWIDKLQEVLSPLSYNLLIHYKYDKCDLLSIIFIKNQTPKVLSYKFIQVIEVPLKSCGALASFIEINNSIVCFINCKLQSGYLNKSLRLDDFNQIHKFLLAETYKNNLFKLCQAIFLAGDLNLRLSFKVEKEFKFKNIMEEFYTNSLTGDPNELIKEGLQFDELPLLQKSKLIEYVEGPINFLPTYKIYPKKAGYDKLKYPAWCDRILYSSGIRSQFRLNQNSNIECKEYKRVEQNLGSSHKGVVGRFQFSVKQANSELKSELIHKYLYK